MGETGADSNESAIRGFRDGEIAKNFALRSGFSLMVISIFRKILPKMIEMDTFEKRKNSVQIGYPWHLPERQSQPVDDKENPIEYTVPLLLPSIFCITPYNTLMFNGD